MLAALFVGVWGSAVLVGANGPGPQPDDDPGAAAARHGRYLAYRLVRAHTLQARMRRVLAFLPGAAPPSPRDAPDGDEHGGSVAAAPPADSSCGEHGGGSGHGQGGGVVAAAGSEEDRRVLEVFVGSALNPSGVLHREMNTEAAHMLTAFGSLLFTRSGTSAAEGAKELCDHTLPPQTPRTRGRQGRLRAPRAWRQTTHVSLRRKHYQRQGRMFV